MGFYTDKKILITGGTGTIGQQLVSRILQDKPAVIRIFSRDEYKQFEMQQSLFEHNKTLRYLIGDVRDAERLTRAMEGIDFVFHLAAMKHVPACEYNPFEAVQTNVIGTQNVIQAAVTNRVKKVLFTSSDKAISPTNTYGATKLMAERMISAAEYQKGPKSTIFSSVRFGNVMGSRGSVIPLFKRQILEQGYINVTDMKMKRYMMTASEAITLMLKANETAQGGELFVMKMPVIQLSDLAMVMIEQVKGKYELNCNVEIKEIGLRPGEKMYEELMSDDEMLNSLETPDIYIIPSQFNKKRQYEGAVRTNKKPSLSTDHLISSNTLANWLLAEELI
jgi:UDP-N-acetylglucosamine 4,6-dehydratase